MAVRSKEEILSAVKGTVSDLTTNESIALMEDISDTYDDLLSKQNNDSEDWQKKYEENDKEWRRKYVERFESSAPQGEQNDNSLLPTVPENETEDNEPQSYEDLFKNN